MKEPKAYFQCKASHIIKYAPQLDKYFGYNAGYYNHRIQLLMHKDEIEPDDDFDVIFPYYITFSEIEDLYSKFFTEPVNKQLFDVLTLISNLIYGDSLGRTMDSLQDAFEEIYYADMAREEFLEFYIWWKSRKDHDTIRIMSKGKREGFNLENRMGWFDNMIEDYHKRFYPDITSVEQARKSLVKEKKGRKTGFDSNNIKTVIYGLSQLMKDYAVTTSPYSTDLCKFIRDFLVLIKYCPAIDPYNTPSNIKAKISNVIRGKEAVPRFQQIGEVKIVTDRKELESAGRRRF